jgi:hypothetical protein
MATRYIIYIIFLFVSCQEKVEDVIVKSENKYISISKGLQVYKLKNIVEIKDSNSFKVIDSLDILNFKLSEEEKQLINKSFNKEKIYTFEDSEKEIGEIENTIKLPKMIEIKTNRRNILVEYNYFFYDQKYIINKDKTKRFNNFMRTIDSIIYYKEKLKENNIFKKN